MPSLKDIRNRIRSVKNTQKITQAMKMVAAAKVKRAEGRMRASRPYTYELRRVMTDVYNEMKNQTRSLSGSRYIELLEPRPVKDVGIIVISSDRGLCGSYNASIIRQALRLDKELKAQGLTPKFFLVGNKVIQAFKRYSDSEVLGTLANMTASPEAVHADQIAETMVKAFLDDKIDSIDILGTGFVSMISYKIRVTPVMPIKGILQDYLVKIDPSQSWVNQEDLITPPEGLRPELLLEPDPVATLDKLLPMYISNIIYMQLLEATASELAARMNAMSNATNNAREMIGKLTLDYNKARQASITQELLEVVAGAEALG